MNYSIVKYFLGCVLNIEAAFLLIPFFVGLGYGESEAWSYLICAFICLALGVLMVVRKPKNNKFYAREGFVTVALSWIVMSALGALPLVMSGDMHGYMTALFETVSGFTTTGASNLLEVESMSHASLFWRSETHWLGGVGVIMFVLAVVRISGGYSISLMKAESPGPTTDKLRPKIRHTALVLYAIYSFLTFSECILLLICKIPVFDAVTTAISTAGTGGFSVRNAGIAFYQNPAAEIVITVFMILFGVNFNLYYLLIKRKFKETFKNEELRVYLAVILTSVAVITLNVYKSFPRFGDAVRNVFFTIGSIISSTGFSTVDFNNWPTFSKLLIILLMFCGACAGSTGGGMKVARIIVLLKSSIREIRHSLSPKSITPVRMDAKKMPGETVKGITAYFVIEMALIAGSIIIVSLDKFDTTTVVTSVITCFHNIGPGLNVVGPTGNFADFTILSKIVLILDMLFGRLEILPLLALFAPATWKRN